MGPDLQGVYKMSCISMYNTEKVNTDITRAQIYFGNFGENHILNNVKTSCCLVLLEFTFADFGTHRIFNVVYTCIDL